VVGFHPSAGSADPSGQVAAREASRLSEVELVPVTRDEQVRIKLLPQRDVERVGAAHSQGRAKSGADFCAIDERVIECWASPG
jgi:hypothetical protein